VKILFPPPRLQDYNSILEGLVTQDSGEIMHVAVIIAMLSMTGFKEHEPKKLPSSVTVVFDAKDDRKEYEIILRLSDSGKIRGGVGSSFGPATDEGLQKILADWSGAQVHIALWLESKTIRVEQLKEVVERFRECNKVSGKQITLHVSIVPR
jgi:hypothetical protein